MNISSFLIGPRRRQGGVLALTALGGFVLLGTWLAPRGLFQGYWYGLMFWTELSIGCLIVALLQFLTGGLWGRVAFPFLRVGISGLYGLIPLFVPPLLALRVIFPWATAATESPRAWLNPTGFVLRAIFYLAALVAIAAWTRNRIGQGDPAAKWAGPLLAAVILLLSLASCDWMMSLQLDFYSSLYPFLYFSGAMVAVFSLLCAVSARLRVQGDWPECPEVLHDLGKLLFAAVLFWGYLVFSQFIIVWSGNLPREAAWYVARTSQGWLPFTLAVLTFHFAIPFCLLLSQRLKKDPLRLGLVAGALFLVHFAEVWWMTRPRLSHGFHVDLLGLLAALLIGAWWVWSVGAFFPEAIAVSRNILRNEGNRDE